MKKEVGEKDKKKESGEGHNARMFRLQSFRTEGNPNGFRSSEMALDAFMEEELFRLSVEESDSVSVITDRWGMIRYANKAFLKVTGKELAALKGRKLDELIAHTANQRSFNRIKNALLRGISWKGELFIPGKYFPVPVKLNIRPVKDRRGFISHFIVSGMDLSAFYNTRKELKEAKEENRILLSELHHRVKNNLAIISGMMELQAFGEESDQVKDRLNVSVGRVRSIALAHEVLFQEESMSRLDLSNVVRRVLSTCRQRYHVKGEEKVIDDLRMSPVYLDINQAHNCALILNEVFTGHFRQVNGDGPALPLTVSLFEKEREVHLEIRGLATSADPNHNLEDERQKNSLLIQTLVKQLRGQSSYESRDSFGSLFRLRFRKEVHKGAQNGIGNKGQNKEN